MILDVEEPMCASLRFMPPRLVVEKMAEPQDHVN